MDTGTLDPGISKTKTYTYVILQKADTKYTAGSEHNTFDDKVTENLQLGIISWYGNANGVG